MSNILNWEDFVKNFTDKGDYREFSYGDKIFVFSGNKAHSFFCIEYLGEIIVHEDYKTPEMLIENVQIEGKSLQKIWNELTLCD